MTELGAMALAVLTPLFLLCIYNKHCLKSNNRAASCVAVLLFTAASYLAGSYEPIGIMEQAFGFHLYTAATPFLTILALYGIHAVTRDRLTSCLMALFTLYISVIIICGYVEGIGIQSEWVIAPAQALVFAIECALMFSITLTNRVHRGILSKHGSIRRHVATGGNRAAHMVRGAWRSAFKVDGGGDN